jgi:hypothetical protein
MAALFVVGATFQPTPFETLVRGRRAIGRYFADLFVSRLHGSFAAQVLGAGDTYGIAHWHFTRPDTAVDGVLVAALDTRGRCTSLRQWWHELEEPTV